MAFTAGDRLGPYEVAAKIGAGGMGEVYRAMDPRLRREVAIKVLRGASSPELRIRFLQEARAASALNHPNIVHVYDVGSEGDVDYIVMELVEGETLTRLIGPKGMDTGRAVDYAVQIADALAAAHAAGIVHRDVKPGNVRISRSGTVKVLDFGLAKIAGYAAAGADAETRTMGPETVEGTVVGTVAYMSPEQAECKAVDQRSDIFSFGVMLYEMLTGRRIFERDSVAATMSAILRDDPPPLKAARPVERIAAGCLRKDAAARFQSMDEVAGELRTVHDGRARRRIPWRALAWAPFLAFIVCAVWWLWPRSSTLRATELTRVTSDTGLTIDPALSPDGKYLAYASDRAGGPLNLWMQQADGSEPVRVTNGVVDDAEPAFSPDGTHIAFSSKRDGGGIFVIPALGGTPLRIANEGRGPRFSPDGQWVAYWVGDEAVFSANRTYVVSRNGGEPRRLAPTFFSAFSPLWSPDGKYILFAGAKENRRPAAEQYDWWVTPLDGGTPAATGIVPHLARNSVFPFSHEPNEWAGNSILFSATTNTYAQLTRVGISNQLSIWRQRISFRSWRPDGKPERLTEGAGIEVQPSVAGGKLALATTTENLGIWTVPLDPKTGRASGELERVLASNATNQYPAVSRDGSKLVFISDRQKNFDVFQKDLRSGEVRALTATEYSEVAPIPNADGKRVLYYVWQGERKPSNTFWEVNTEGGTPRLVCGDCEGPLYYWSNDERKVIYFKEQPGTPGVLMAHDLESRAESVFAAHPKYALRLPRLSPDERWASFQAVVSQTQRRLFVAAVRDWRVAPEAEWTYIPDARAPAAWSESGDLLYFLSDRDGFRCIWAQRLNRANGRPVGDPFAVLHLHTAHRSLTFNIEIAAIGLSIAANKLYFSVPEHTGNVWLAQLEGHP
jgi:Tol biopolymer transport system component